mmetsp:Transcript_23647/g.51877  ORF Transcript_23647/g.51877 Transcript_23647/m.51877 type:complete len:1150 (-) Transcript_23647:739-4188(-)|eukprot:CAMPEP_0202894032 /NCGR_PEP_ID=MMETSP1392-20130828/3493_1 /ASSEMBLY_ACC=CAM_ASM_000868 /TAXON_ID=225041 /ORGANISM="Chlamydomonas chlamydogama, Strain SAG 11-48b" /LENGTH=1149 /DNA_ID=CAMNT_0049578569 /DNA_START=127 /DNA_END=3576 /DNA_ORIENTATION=-
MSGIKIKIKLPPRPALPGSAAAEAIAPPPAFGAPPPAAQPAPAFAPPSSDQVPLPGFPNPPVLKKEKKRKKSEDNGNLLSNSSSPVPQQAPKRVHLADGQASYFGHGEGMAPSGDPSPSTTQRSIPRKLTINRPGSLNARPTAVDTRAGDGGTPGHNLSNHARSIAEEIFLQHSAGPAGQQQMASPPPASKSEMKQQKKMEKQQMKEAKEQQKVQEKEEKKRAREAEAAEKVRLKNEAAAEKARAKAEEAQEKQRAADTASMVRNIIKIRFGSKLGGDKPSTSAASGGSGEGADGGPGALGGTRPPAAAPSAPHPAAPQPRAMAPSKLFLSATAGAAAGVKIKPKIKLPRPGGVMKHVHPGGSAAPGHLPMRPPVGHAHAAAGAVAATVSLTAAAAVGGQQASSGPAPPSRENLLLVLNKIQNRDNRKIFEKPVTEAQAPGYFSVIERPMDFTTMHTKLEAGEYKTWEDMRGDLDLMFANCKKFNPQPSVYFEEAVKMEQVTTKIMDLVRQGITNFRGRTAGIVRRANARFNHQVDRERAQQLQHANLGRGMRHAAADAEAAAPAAAAPVAAAPAATAAGVTTHRAAAGTNFYALHHGAAAAGPAGRARGSRPVGGGGVKRPAVSSAQLDAEAWRAIQQAGNDDIRVTYRPRATAAPTNPGVPVVPFAPWAGLANGANAEGIPFANGKPMLKSTLHKSAALGGVYLSSVSRFVARCGSKIRRAVMRRMADTVAVEGTSAAVPASSPGTVAAAASTTASQVDLGSVAALLGLPLPVQSPAPGYAAHSQMAGATMATASRAAVGTAVAQPAAAASAAAVTPAAQAISGLTPQQQQLTQQILQVMQSTGHQLTAQQALQQIVQAQQAQKLQQQQQQQRQAGLAATPQIAAMAAAAAAVAAKAPAAPVPQPVVAQQQALPPPPQMVPVQRSAPAPVPAAAAPVSATLPMQQNALPPPPAHMVPVQKQAPASNALPHLASPQMQAHQQQQHQPQGLHHHPHHPHHQHHHHQGHYHSAQQPAQVQAQQQQQQQQQQARPLPPPPAMVPVGSMPPASASAAPPPSAFAAAAQGMPAALTLHLGNGPAPVHGAAAAALAAAAAATRVGPPGSTAPGVMSAPNNLPMPHHPLPHSMPVAMTMDEAPSEPLPELPPVSP